MSDAEECVLIIRKLKACLSAVLIYSETSFDRFRRGSQKETMDPGKQ
jgi:hypothetical protein